MYGVFLQFCMLLSGVGSFMVNHCGLPGLGVSIDALRIRSFVCPVGCFVAPMTSWCVNITSTWSFSHQFVSFSTCSSGYFVSSVPSAACELQIISIRLNSNRLNSNRKKTAPRWAGVRGQSRQNHYGVETDSWITGCAHKSVWGLGDRYMSIVSYHCSTMRCNHWQRSTALSAADRYNKRAQLQYWGCFLLCDSLIYMWQHSKSQ
jgi:hypothetical protein